MGSSRVPEVLEMIGYVDYPKPDAIEAAAVNATIVTDVAISGLVAGALTIAAQPDYPRNMRVTLTDANGSITGGTVTVVGLDASGEAITDIITLTGAGTVNGVKAFAKVTKATWALVTGTVTTTDDKIAVGMAGTLGLPMMPGGILPVLVKATFDGADEASTINQTYKTITPAGTLDASKSISAIFRYKYLLKGHDLNA